MLNIKDAKSGIEVKFAPPPVEIPIPNDFRFAPRFGEHNKEIYGKLGYDIKELKKQGIIK